METTLNICPRCQQRFVRTAYSGDFIHKCHGQEVLKNEDVIIIGDWEDYTGSDVNVHPSMLRGAENRLFGTRAWVEGGDEESTRSSRGFPQNRFRTRQHLHFISEGHFKVKGEKSQDNPEEFDG